ncbi:MAG: hypothetical protein H6696_05585 [Deferribacteres bacterium]|nr:hypothetical protein [candidate division KSB1 bacterium]MCB9501390.1 hypothetical protein [Deferribacteres bacterium]
MKTIIPYAIILVIAVALLGGDAQGLLGFFFLMQILYAAFHLIFKQKLPKDFWGNIVLLFFVPTIILCLIAAIVGHFKAWQLNDDQFFILAILFAFMLYGWSAWRRWRNRKKQPDNTKLKHSERKFISSYPESQSS